MPLPNITLVGNLTADPELRFTPSGKAVANFTVACSSSKKNEQTGEWEETGVMFVRCAVWEQKAENIAESFIRGTSVIVTGQLYQRDYETREGEKRTAIECRVFGIAAEVKNNVTVKVNKAARSGDGSFSTPPPGEDPWASSGGFTDEPPF